VLFLTVSDGLDGPPLLATADAEIIRALAAIVSRRLAGPTGGMVRSLVRPDQRIHRDRAVKDAVPTKPTTEGHDAPE
jgi:hypothetical protein